MKNRTSDMTNNKLILTLGFIFTLIACGGGGGAPSDKNLSLTIENSRSFNESVSYGQIDYYQISISADDLADPFVEKFSGDSESARMLGIPVGKTEDGVLSLLII